MSMIVKVPAVSSNEDFATIVRWEKATGEHVKAGETLCVIETTKSAVDIESETSGYLTCLIGEQQQVGIGQPIAAITDLQDEDVFALLGKLEKPEASEKKWTKKAELVASRLGVDIHELAKEHPGKVISEADVVRAAQPTKDVKDLLDDNYPAGRQERLILVGGGGGGGVIVLDALSRIQHQRVVGILDNNPLLHGKTLMGVPVLGPNSLAGELWAQGACDAMVNVVTAKLEERFEIFDRLTKQGIRFANVIDPSVSIRANVSMGQGNLIMGGGYLAVCVSLGDNNFFASHVCIEHHSRIGSHCTFGPRCTASGAVNVGDKVKLGMTVAIEPYISIGDGALIPSGVVVTSNIPPNSVLKIKEAYSVRSRLV